MEHTSRVGQRVDMLQTADVHERYYDNGIPILSSTPTGNRINKSVTEETAVCPECDDAARYADDGVPICPSCGMVCGGSDSQLTSQIIADSKAAGRIQHE